MKRVLVGLGLVLLCAALFAGGQKEGAAGKPAVTTVTFADWLSAQDAFREPLVTALGKYSEQNPHVRLKHVYWQYEQYLDQLFVLLSAGEAPDVALLPFDSVPVFAARKALATLDDWYTQERTDSFYPAGLKSSTYEGHYVGVPFFASGIGLLRNTKLFGRAGLDPKRSPRTWDEYLSAARAVSSLGADIFGTDVRYSGGAMVMYIWPWFVQGGGGIVDANGKVVVDGEGTTRTLKFLNQMYQEGLQVPGAPIQREVNEQFALNKLAFLYQGAWIYKVLASTDPNFRDYDVSEPPAGPAGQGTGYHGGNLVMFAQTKQRQEALGLIEFWVSEAGQSAIWAAQNCVGTKDAWERHAKTHPFAGTEGFLPNWTETYMKLLNYAAFDNMLFFPETGKLAEIFQTEVTRALLQQKTPEQALKDAGQQMRNILGQ